MRVYRLAGAVGRPPHLGCLDLMLSCLLAVRMGSVPLRFCWGRMRQKCSGHIDERFSFHLWPEADYWLHSAEIFLEGFHKGIIQFTELTLVISEPESRSSLQDDFSECPAAAPLSPLLSPKLLWSQLEWRVLSWDFKVLHGRSLQSALGSVDGQVICALTCWQPNPLHSFVSSDSITLKSTRELGKSHS